MARSGYVFVCFLCAFITLCSSCNYSAKKGAEQNQQYTPNVPEGWQALFNGNTLENWEVTSFGTEGPVKVYGGKYRY